MRDQGPVSKGSEILGPLLERPYLGTQYRPYCPEANMNTVRYAHRIRNAALCVLLVLPVACAPEGESAGPGTTHADLISVDRLKEVTRTLASDEFEGRGPSSPGEEKTVAYLQEQFAAAGLQPGNGDSWTQDVPLVSITVLDPPALSVETPDGSRALGWPDDFVGWTKRVVPTAGLASSELVFVGYGIVAPEYGWDDYAGLDVTGKTVIILVNDPGYATQDEALFNGNAMTYYGRWTYKFEEAARQGASGALVVHETGPAGYPWAVVESSWTGPQFGLAAEDDNMGRVAVEGWISGEAAADLFQAAGQDYEGLTAAAAQPGFLPIELPLSASVTLNNEIRRSISKNVVGVLPGANRPDEYVVYMAHWDHFGVSDDPSLEDRIYNGAFDNATGTAGLVEMAHAFVASGPHDRSAMFLAVTAEEQGLQGSAHYAANPLVPTNQTVAAVNMDGLLVSGPTRDIVIIGYGNSELDRYLERYATEAGRTLVPDQEPEKGYFYRSDHFAFAKVGVPALYTEGGIDDLERGPEWGMAQRADYVANRYHKPSDEFDEAWTFGGAVADLYLLYEVGNALANSEDWPNWAEGNEFKAARDQDRAR